MTQDKIQKVDDVEKEIVQLLSTVSKHDWEQIEARIDQTFSLQESREKLDSSIYLEVIGMYQKR
ncbi:hypothetical protein [Secundilactobacillus similis]|uniref:Uncharacterized protein n=1 Tax=Secundilactobacillus similis DSM 23365 = JCM 2765 TaxID=1423804 RepID=A0A0R2F5C0_9LACO|nr:hypothetical protein [Secundilactobacillus similis]KRN20663.1 hypothetical protein FD14_GL001453 [Secundilactobacillus similis DSM 23365 = JCM 2765]